MTAPASSLPPRFDRRRYWMRLLRLTLVALVGMLFFLPFLLGLLTIWGLTHPPCSPGRDPSAFNPAYEDIAFSSTKGLRLTGYFIPGANTATIIIVPTFASGRGGGYDYARVFNQAGFNVLMFDGRVCTAQGWISLGYQEVEDVEAAYRYLETRGDIDLTRIGLHGFSSAEATAIMAAAQMPEIRSISVEGGYHDYADTLGLNDGSDNLLIRLYQFGVAGGYRVITGDDIRVLSPISVIDRLPPRPLLLIYGDREVSLPGAKLMLDKALATGVQAELWIVPGADHGDYLAVAPDEYVQRVIAFHRVALLDERNS